MLEKGKISNRQLTWLIIMTSGASALLFLPSVIAKHAGPDSWLSVIFVSIFGLIIGYNTTKLGQRFPNQTITNYSQLIVGKFLGKFITFIYILFFIHITATILREFGEVAVSIFLVKTPILLMMGLIMVVVASAVRNGIEVISRVNEINFYSLFIFLSIIFLLIIPDLNTSNLHPVLENGLIPVLKGSYVGALFLAETIVLVIILPTVNQTEKVFHSVFKAITLIMITGIIVMLEIITLFGMEAGELTIPMLSLIRYIEVFDFLERIDPLVVTIWFGGGFIKIAIFYYCAVISTAEFFNLKSYKPVVLPLGVIIIALAMILYGSIHGLSVIIFEIIPPYYLFVEAVLPLLLLIVARVKGIGGNST